MSQVKTAQSLIETQDQSSAERIGLRWFFAWCTVAFVARMLPAGAMLSQRLRDLRGVEGGALPVGTDALYHMRRIQQVVADFPNVPTFDPYLKFPDGALIPYEPGLDLALAWLARLFGGPTPDPAFVEIVAVLSIPFLGVLLVPLYTAVTAQLFGRHAAKMAMPLLAILPGCVVFSSAGQVDHHVLEPLTFVGPMLPLLAAIKRSNFSPQPTTVLTLSVTSGVLLGLCFLFWRGSIIPASLIAGYLGLRTAERSAGNRLVGFDLWGGPVILGTAAALTTPFYVSHPMGLAGEISYFTPSWFQPLYLSTLALGLSTLGAGIAFLGPSIGQNRRWIYPIAIPSGLAPLTALCLISPSFLENLVKGLGFVGRTDSFVKAVVEQLPLFMDFDHNLTLLPAFTLYGLTLILAPFAAIHLLKRKHARGGALFWLWLLGVFAMALLQRRYAVLFSPVLAVLIGAAAAHWLNHARGFFPRPITYLAYLTLLVHGSWVLAQTIEIKPQTPQTLELTRWIRENTPKTKSFELKAQSEAIQITQDLDSREYRGSQQPGEDNWYGIVAKWTLGHHLSYLAQRPAIANPFGIEWFRDGVAQTARFLLSTSPADEMQSMGARYAVVGYSLISLRLQAELAGLDPDLFATQNTKGYQPEAAYWKTASARLYLQDGLGTDTLEALPQLRLIYETPTNETSPLALKLAGHGELSALKVFEWVPGVQIIGMGPSDCTVEASMDIISNRGREFTWSQHMDCDINGNFEFTVPYANLGSRQNRTWGKSSLRLVVSNPNSVDKQPWISKQSISDAQVLEGQISRIRWHPPAAIDEIEKEESQGTPEFPSDNPSDIGPKP